MFYSQFILAKKGPLGTIWIAAHLERKLRKNQVADTDIGVSVDSILFPEAPIALRLSSHLLLGVVRIYSRKVNYLFDDCSEALLKIKQAFRSTAVDLPPEETTAPYHSITLPETFDLDDFELPDGDIFQGSYVDHHTSTREQITLQDSMQSVVYSTTQFGLYERFGDGDTSGLDLDEELLLNKVAASGHAVDMLGSDAEVHASVQPKTPLGEGKTQGLDGNSEGLVASGGVNQLEGLTGHADLVEYAQAPCTPGLMEEPNLLKIQEASACDDHLELGEEPNLFNIRDASASDDHLVSDNPISTQFAANGNLEKVTGNLDLHSGNGNAGDLSFPDDMSPVTVLGGQEIKQLRSWGDSSSTTGNILSDELAKAINPVSESPDQNFTVLDGANGVEDLQNKIVGNNVPGAQSIDGACTDNIELHGVGLDETVSSPWLDETISSPNFSHEGHVLEGSFVNSFSAIKSISENSSLSSTWHPSPECILEISQASLTMDISNNVENAGNMEKSWSLTNEVASKPESTSRDDHENFETQACRDRKGSNIVSPVVHQVMAAADMHVLQPCMHLNLQSMENAGCDAAIAYQLLLGVTDLCLMEMSGRKEAPGFPGASTEVKGEGSHADSMESVPEENHTREPASCKDIQVDFSKLNDEEPNMISRDTQLEKLDGSENSELPAPEKLLSVSEALANLQDNFLVESTPNEAHLTTGDRVDAGINNISGKRRSFSESTLTVQSLNLVELIGVARSNSTKESVPDDNDLLSSILVGRRSSVLKMKASPIPLPEIACMKRPRSAPRVSASKRKVLMDDTMVLYGDVIRQQLTTTEDIRRIRKKAPCTRPEIWMNQKEFFEDEIFSEPIFVGLSTELALWHGKTYDLSEIKVSQNDAHDAFLEAAADLNFVSKKDENNHLETSNDVELSMEPNAHKESETGGIHESMIVRNDVQADVEAVAPGNRQGEEHAFWSQFCDTQVQMDVMCDILERQSLPHENSREITEVEIDGASMSLANAVTPIIDLGVESAPSTDQCPVLGDENNRLAGSMIPAAVLDKEGVVYGSLQMDGVGVSPDQKLDAQSVGMDASIVYLSRAKGVDDVKVAEESVLSSTVGRTESRARDEFLLEENEGGASLEIGAILQTPHSAHSGNENSSLLPETVRFSNQVVLTIDQAMEEIRKSEHGVVNVEEVIAAEMDYDGKNMASCVSNGEPKVTSSYTVELNVNVQNACSNNGDYPGFQEADPQCTIDAETSAVGHAAGEDCGAFDYTIFGHDTGFLNADDDDDDDDAVEEEDNYVPSMEQTNFFENSGWSSRTRAVAKYLQVLFVKESEHERKFLPMDRLLMGKSRKEVLKTRDYIHVEQGAPFGNISIEPRVELIESCF